MVLSEKVTLSYEGEAVGQAKGEVSLTRLWALVGARSCFGAKDDVPMSVGGPPRARWPILARAGLSPRAGLFSRVLKRNDSNSKRSKEAQLPRRTMID